MTFIMAFRLGMIYNILSYRCDGKKQINELSLKEIITHKNPILYVLILAVINDYQ